MISGAHFPVEPTDASVAKRPFRADAADDPEQRDIAIARAVVRAKQGDDEAIRYLYLRCADKVYGYVKSIVKDDYEAEDLTQHVFAKLMVVLPKYEQRESTFLAWLLRVARNVAMDHLRQRRAIPCEDVRTLENGSKGADLVMSLSLRSALAELPEEQREVVILRHVVGLTPGEIALRLGRSEPSVHGLHHRGRGALRNLLTEMDACPAVMAA
jgi:RNA polymerase sigma-70 factor (ECF subfamily)